MLTVNRLLQQLSSAGTARADCIDAFLPLICTASLFPCTSDCRARRKLCPVACTNATCQRHTCGQGG
eukprot:TRINITY_DN3413_c0_g1_i1.p1 TRINITY_DN3413_c0_g1~~TRINITY_DN3413_c0_g1_i1.p1  ORF type:complete len:67 (-),score=8.84 TRINITY_DN3413_c0_g1_i1:92-292(-)